MHNCPVPWIGPRRESWFCFIWRLSARHVPRRGRLCMKTLILTADDCSAGRLKASKAADRVLGMNHRLVEGPLPNNEEQTAFFGSVRLTHELQCDIHHWQACIGFSDRQRLGLLRPSLVEACQEYDRIEIWTDSDPNSYLILFQLIDALKPHPDILDRLWLGFPSRYIGELSAAKFENARPHLQPLKSEQVDLLSRAWHAHQRHTPEACFSLLKLDLAGIPGLHALILRILAELPDAANGLSASEAQLLALIKCNGANYETVFGGYVQLRPRATLDYWEVGRRIISLSRCNPPIIIGVGEDSFSLDLHDDKARFDAFRARTWSLSALGQRIAEAQDDLAKYVSVDRWLGNTHLTPDRLWRWDATSEALVEPR